MLIGYHSIDTNLFTVFLVQLPRFAKAAESDRRNRAVDQVLPGIYPKFASANPIGQITNLVVQAWK